MHDLSIRGIARKYRNRTGTLSVVQDILGNQPVSGGVAIRPTLENLARQTHTFGMSECIFGWTASFEQTWTHIRIRIQLNPDAGITQATMNTLMGTWRTGIENVWNNRWGCGFQGECTCPLTFEVEWVSSNPHHNVQVSVGPGRANMGHWYTTGSGGVAAHEYGHMLGLVDEYPENPPCPNRSPVSTGTVMDNNSANVPQRLMNRFASNIGSNVVAIP